MLSVDHHGCYRHEEDGVYYDVCHCQIEVRYLAAKDICIVNLATDTSSE